MPDNEINKNSKLGFEQRARAVELSNVIIDDEYAAAAEIIFLRDRNAYLENRTVCKSGDVVFIQMKRPVTLEQVAALKKNWEISDVGVKLVVLDDSMEVVPNIDTGKLRQDIAAATAHRGCCGAEHDPANGKLHGYCVVCGVPWPCETAEVFLRKK